MTVDPVSPLAEQLIRQGLDCASLDPHAVRVTIRTDNDRDLVRDAAAATGVGLRRLHPDGPSIEQQLLEAIG